MKFTPMLVAAAITAAASGVAMASSTALASQVDPKIDINRAATLESQLPFGSTARTKVDQAVRRAQRAYNDHNRYQAYVDAQNALALEQQSLNTNSNTSKYNNNNDSSHNSTHRFNGGNG